jgi:hypothetical protein
MVCESINEIFQCLHISLFSCYRRRMFSTTGQKANITFELVRISQTMRSNGKVLLVHVDGHGM